MFIAQDDPSYRVSEYTQQPLSSGYNQNMRRKPSKIRDYLEVLDQSAAEYDCADEAMDGPDSVCLDDLILQ